MTKADDPANENPEPAAEVTAGQNAPRVISAEEIFAGRREVWIQLGNQQYRLRITATGKLILTK